MKKLFLFTTILSMALLLHAQNSPTNPVDEMFDKYSRRDGFTVVSISSKMFSMLANMDTENKDQDNLMSRLKSIRILSVEDSLLNNNLNFYDELNKKFAFATYEELMVVKEGRDVTKFLIKQTGNYISELLVISGGPDGNSLISIRGEFSLKNISDMSKDMGMDELKSLEGVDKKKIKK